jgi:predicted SAM-dependent methyltransferase
MQVEAVIRQVDLGCGTRKKEGFYGVDIDQYEGVDLVQDLRFTPLPFQNKQLEHVYASHFFEHLDFHEVIYLLNEIYRCMKVGGKLEVIVPHATSYGHLTDLSHKTAWTEDTMGYITPENKYYYSWFYEKDGERHPVINKWKILKNDSTPPYQYTTLGWTEVKLREVHYLLEKIE